MTCRKKEMLINGFAKDIIPNVLKQLRPNKGVIVQIGDINP